MFTFLCVMRILRSITIKKASSRRSLMSLCYKTSSPCSSCAYVDILSTWEVGRALKRLELHSAAPHATLAPLSCSPNFPRAQYLDIRTLMHELIVKQTYINPTNYPVGKTGKQTFLKTMSIKTGLSWCKSLWHFFICLFH